MSISQIALGFITATLTVTLSYQAIADKIKPDAYVAGMMGVLAAWLRIGDSTKETPIQQAPTIKDRPKL